ncbi:phosphatidylinositol N-acetylglucosaminyltransferase subunit C [Neocloeon triangulifer]|uniref:phosphatidylinositol N-acetylglucosaminyltransferase subunit C n=1 Tax=Neocloeon triangulifer TaxID=2078957 RepID=UPI00286F473E|nr:phosphatidylinositol N-acetylglucosaminyltransferase subunit C [Neocloeon triangulifer]
MEMMENSEHKQIYRPEPVTWRRVLYENQGLPDNYTDTTFLYELKKNVNLRILNFSDAVSGARLLSREISVVVIVGEVFIVLQDHLTDPLILLLFVSFFTLVGYIMYVAKYKTRSIFQDFVLALTYIFIVTLVSPILKTLTETISTDTIYVTSVLMMLAHLMFYDYDSFSTTVSKALSFNSALFGSLCLASRLSSSFDVFVLLTVAVSCFALLPPLMSEFGRSNAVATFFDLVALTGLFYLSITAFVLYTVGLFILNIAIPYLIVRWQKYKENISGPWDEAKPSIGKVNKPKPANKAK